MQHGVLTTLFPRTLYIRYTLNIPNGVGSLLLPSSLLDRSNILKHDIDSNQINVRSSKTHLVWQTLAFKFLTLLLIHFIHLDAAKSFLELACSRIPFPTCSFALNFPPHVAISVECPVVNKIRERFDVAPRCRPRLLGSTLYETLPDSLLDRSTTSEHNTDLRGQCRVTKMHFGNTLLIISYLNTSRSRSSFF